MSTGKYLSTKKVPLPVHGQYSAVCTGQNIDAKNDSWKIIGAFKINVKNGGLISSSTVVRLMHQDTGENLHSHGVIHGGTPKSNHQQATVFRYKHSDDNWLLQCYNSITDDNDSAHLMSGDIISLLHKNTNQPLYSHEVLLDDGTQETFNCNSTLQWRIELIRKPIKYESTIALFHVPTRKYLSTKRVKYPNHKQNMVVCTGKELDFEHDLWTICDMNVKSPLLTCNIIGFKHKETGEKLHSHFIEHGKTPKSNHQQVTLFMRGNPDDHWIIRHHGSKVDLDHLMDGDIINLFHKCTNLPLYSHDVLMDDGTQEVSCNGDGSEDNNMV
ncbi:17834_t:CDS:2 [Acaulospora morrowiae]|uniref:17834_t:CDS:1 n=1 Tax=Acaulospora morrowiae TaxID=94023 RepID=A0A9N8Z6E3_9GLOM|nr:17834_t:CDS:2 [Acaulospora morrowiae]